MNGIDKFWATFWRSIFAAFIIMLFWTIAAATGKVSHFYSQGIMQLAPSLAISIPQAYRFWDFCIGLIFPALITILISKSRDKNGLKIEGVFVIVGLVMGAIIVPVAKMLRAEDVSMLVLIGINALVIGIPTAFIPRSQQGKISIVGLLSWSNGIGYGAAIGIFSGIIPGIVSMTIVVIAIYLTCSIPIFLVHTKNKISAARKAES